MAPFAGDAMTLTNAQKYLDLRWTIISLTSLPLTLLVSHSVFIAIALAILIIGIGAIRKSSDPLRTSQIPDEVWPEVIDHLISGIQSGMSLTESFLGLAERGPLPLRPIIKSAGKELARHGDFEITLNDLKAAISSPSSDQICEAISLSRTLGGSELIYVLRTLGEFLRTELATKREIEVKHGWIKNSAHLSAIAPWLLLLLLSTQRSTSEAFSTPTGIAILMGAVAATCVAYIWMNLLARLPKPPRVFGVRL